ncbi:MAG: amino acid ABC transporter permease [Clostridiales bacterium]|nr:amino acid ABC transporter permease [Clostridiales bacterium]
MFKNLLSQLVQSMGATLSIFVITLVLSLPLGLLVAFGRMSKCKPLKALVSLYILLMRGTPLMLQLFAVYFFLPSWLGIKISRIHATYIAFTLNYAAYFAEIYRSGIASVPQGQYEAGKVLGLSKSQTFFRIIFPQVIKHILLPVGNEAITLVKDTSLASTIAVSELFRVAKDATSSSASLVPLFTAGIFFLLLNTLVTLFFHFSEKKLEYYKV